MLLREIAPDYSSAPVNHCLLHGAAVYVLIIVKQRKLDDRYLPGELLNPQELWILLRVLHCGPTLGFTQTILLCQHWWYH